jgi:hypothetical protein
VRCWGGEEVGAKSEGGKWIVESVREIRELARVEIERKEGNGPAKGRRCRGGAGGEEAKM